MKNAVMQIERTREANFRLLHLFSLYLNERSDFITAEMVKDGAVVIDVGTNRVDDPTHPKGSRLVGDVDFENVKDKTSAISPVPGGVGPMTICMLMANAVKAAEKASEVKP